MLKGTPRGVVKYKKNILNMYGHGANWDRQQTDLSGYISHIKENMYSKCIDDWHNSIQNSVANPILRTYKLFKTEFQMEPYLTHVKQSSNQTVPK